MTLFKIGDMAVNSHNGDTVFITLIDHNGDIHVFCPKRNVSYCTYKSNLYAQDKTWDYTQVESKKVVSYYKFCDILKINVELITSLNKYVLWCKLLKKLSQNITPNNFNDFIDYCHIFNLNHDKVSSITSFYALYEKVQVRGKIL